MKKIIATGFVLVVMIAAVIYAGGKLSASVQPETDYLRIHVRANSNEQIDQNVKYIVKDEVVKFIPAASRPI